MDKDAIGCSEEWNRLLREFQSLMEFKKRAASTWDLAGAQEKEAIRSKWAEATQQLQRACTRFVEGLPGDLRFLRRERNVPGFPPEPSLQDWCSDACASLSHWASFPRYLEDGVAGDAVFYRVPMRLAVFLMHVERELGNRWGVVADVAQVRDLISERHQAP